MPSFDFAVCGSCGGGVHVDEWDEHVSECNPNIEGWSWYDALKKHRPDLLEQSRPEGMKARRRSDDSRRGTDAR